MKNQIAPLNISKPFKSSPNQQLIAIDIDLDELIDRYDYHDAPSAVTVYLDQKQIANLINILTERLNQFTTEGARVK